MSMVLKNNIAAQVSLGELNKNINRLGEALAKVSTGMKINSAQDDSAQFAISELMRVQIRALSQAMQNVQNGNALLRTAEEGIQQQIELVRTIREKVLDAANDTNSEEDRKIIQKEVNQFFDQIEQTAYYTDYNSHKPLLWQKEVTAAVAPVSQEYGVKEIPTYEISSEATVSPTSFLNIINRESIPNLDGKDGVFDTFSPYYETQRYSYRINSTSFDSDIINANNKVGATNQLQLYGGDDEGKAAVLEVDFSKYNIADFISNVSTGLAFTGYNSSGSIANAYFVLTTDPNDQSNEFFSRVTNYRNTKSQLNNYLMDDDYIIDITGKTMTDIASEIANKLSANYSNYFDVARDGAKLTLTSKNKSQLSNGMKMNGNGTYTSYGYDGNAFDYAIERYVKEGKAANIPNATFSGGVDNTWIEGVNQKDGQRATCTIDMSGVTTPSGIYIWGNYYELVRNSDLANFTIDRKITALNLDSPPSNVSGFDLKVNGNSWTFIAPDEYSATSTKNSSWNNNSWYIYGADYVYEIPANEYSPTDSKTYHYKGITPFSDTVTVDTNDDTKKGEDPQRAHYDIDLSAYNNNVQSLIDDFAGKMIYSTTYKEGNYSGRCYYEFYDSSSDTMDKARKIDSSYYSSYNYGGGGASSASTRSVDLANVKSEVEGGRSLSAAFARTFANQYGKTAYYNETDTSRSLAYVSYLDSDGNEFTEKDITSGNRSENEISSMRINSVYNGTTGNSDSLRIYEGVLSHYPINFQTWFDNNTESDIATALDGKGFRFYCATDEDEWFNIVFRKNIGEVPSSLEGIKTLEIDISNVTDAKSLVDAIYETANEKFKTGDSKFDHYFRFAKDKNDSGTLIVYDYRTQETVNQSNFYHNSKGAKIADGVVDNVKQVMKTVPVTDTVITNSSVTIGDPYQKFVIQDTDKSDLNIVVRIPNTRLDSIFNISGLGIDESYEDISDYIAVKDSLGNITGFERTITRGKFLGLKGKSNIREFSLNSKEDREALLGDGWNQGILDKGLEYLLDAAVMVGAQRARLEYAGTNLTTQVENDMAAESTIRDADMAKEMAEYTKYNVLSQSAQAMLAQANQSSSQVLSLLQ